MIPYGRQQITEADIEAVVGVLRSYVIHAAATKIVPTTESLRMR